MELFSDIILNFITIFAVLIGGLWALTTYVIERGLTPAAELYLDCNVIGEKKEDKIIEVTVHILNKATSTLVAKDIQLEMKTICTSDTLSLYSDEKKRGRLKFPNLLGKDLANKNDGNKTDKDNEKKGNAFTLVPHNTFVQANVDQSYPFVTTITKEVEFLFIKSKFKYGQQPISIQRKIIWISRKIGLMQHPLQHIDKPHTVERAFNVSTLSHTSKV